MADMLLDLEIILTRSAKAGSRPNRIRDLHSQPPGLHPELRRALPAGRDDQHGVRGVHDQSGGEPPVRKKTTDAMDAEGRALIAAGPNQGVEQRIGGCIPTMVSAVAH